MRTFINPIWPVHEVRSIEQLMDIAVGMEHEAARRYDSLALEMERRDEAELAKLFRSLAALEQAHEDGLARWAQREGRSPPKPTSFAWQMPETFGSEADGADAHTLTPYRALALAVRNEELAFSFYSYLAAIAELPEVRERAEALASEELTHVAELRTMRRRAWRQNGGRDARAAPRNLAELRSVAWGIESASAELDGQLAGVVEAAGDPGSASVLRLVAEQARDMFMDLPQGGGRGTEAVKAARNAGLLQRGSLTVEGALRLSLRNAEQAFDTYMAAADKAVDEAMLAEAQRLSQLALARLALVRSQLGNPGD